jgi:uncharacterized FAD-dependent dehydrogenase
MTIPNEVVDVAVVGAGPAGLAAAHRLSASGLSTLLLDAGKPVRDRDRDVPAEATAGLGGAGLFSDGKFSFFPSASQLWSLPGRADLIAAYDWTSGVLRDAGLDTPPFPAAVDTYEVGRGEWVLKAYPSDYLDLPTRLNLIERLVKEATGEVRPLAAVSAIRYHPDTDTFRLRLSDGMTIRARRILVATGRFGPLFLDGLTDRWLWRRLEFGVRIEQPAETAFFRDIDQLDPKLRFRDPELGVEWRTFCACRDGEAVLTETNGLWTVSGRADGPPSGRSNIGFNTRILDESVGRAALKPLVTALGRDTGPIDVALLDMLADDRGAGNQFDEVYESPVGDLLRRGLAHLADVYPGLRTPETRLIGPTLEGVGLYPVVDGRLRLTETPAWVAGDACGLFRGIVAAMISGHYAAASLEAAFPAPHGRS